MDKKLKKVLTVGGGSGGHVIPVIAVVEELRKRNPDVEVRFWCDRKFSPKAKTLFAKSSLSVEVQPIAAGKLRRYHGVSIWQQLADTPTLLRNLADIFLIMIGYLESIFKLVVWRPQVVFCKGGFVCLPVGLAARLLGIPLVLHDSDSQPGLTSRLLSSGASFIATGAPLENYSYPVAKTVYTGLPVKAEFKPVSSEKKVALKKSFGLAPKKPLVVIVGGGLGAKPINDALVVIGKQLLRHANVIHVCGSFQYQKLRSKVPVSKHYQLKEFVDESLADILAASDVLVTRAGASTLAEAAAVGAATIIIPNDRLTGGHQTKNAQAFSQKKAAIVLKEPSFVSRPSILLDTVIDLLDDSNHQQKLSTAIKKFHRSDASGQVAGLIVRAANK